MGTLLISEKFAVLRMSYCSTSRSPVLCTILFVCFCVCVFLFHLRSINSIANPPFSHQFFFSHHDATNCAVMIVVIRSSNCVDVGRFAGSWASIDEIKFANSGVYDRFISASQTASCNSAGCHKSLFTMISDSRPGKSGNSTR